MLKTQIAAELAARRDRVFTSRNRRELTRLAWGALMQLHSWLVYQPVWDGTPVVLAEWKKRRIRIPALPEVAALTPSVKIAAEAGNVVTAEALAELLHEALRALETPVAGRRFQPSFPSLADWRRDVRIPHAHLVEELAARPIPGLRSLLLHGSLADGRIVEGYSDFDVAVVLRVPETGAEFLAQTEALLQTNHLLIAHNPLIHHGPMAYFDDYLNDAAEAVLPSAVLAHSVLLAGEPFEVHYGETTEETLRSIDSYEGLFCTRFPGGAEEIRNGFDALWWISTALMIPLLEHQLRTGISIWKRDVLAGSTEPYVKRLSECRMALGEWITARTAGEAAWPAESNVNPGVGARYWKERLVLDRDIGIDDWLVDEVRAAVRRLVPEAIPQRITRYPRRAAMVEYEDLRSHWLRIAEASGYVLAVYEFGSVGCPGLSDLDLLFVVRGGAEALRTLTISACTERQKQLMGHDPLVIPIEAVAALPFILPLFKVRHLWGEQFALPLAEELPREILACAMTAYNFRKYPADLDRIGGDFHSSLVYLHSFSHVARVFEILGEEPPSSVKRCVALDREARARFTADGGLHAGLMAPVMEAMRTAAEDMLAGLDAWWRVRLDWRGAPLLSWLCAYIADPDTEPYFQSMFVERAMVTLQPYRDYKRVFLRAMRRAGMPIDDYLYDWRYRNNATLRSGRFEFERKMGGRMSISLDRELAFRSGGNGLAALVDGWSLPEDWGVWAAGAAARTAFQFGGGSLEIEARSLVASQLARQRVEVICGDRVIAEWTITANEPRAFRTPKLPAGPTVLEFRYPDAASPRELGLSDDGRKLGFGLIAIRGVRPDGSAISAAV